MIPLDTQDTITSVLKGQRPFALVSGEVREALRFFPEKSVHCAVTSPPYWGLREYDLPQSTWWDGWEGQLGLEPDPWRYVDHLVEVCMLVHRALRDDGVFWLNLGDTFAGGGKFHGSPEKEARAMGLKVKDLIGIPWRVAFELQRHGWYLRAGVPWMKRTILGGSQSDRPIVSHEYVFQLAKSDRYYYDPNAVLVESVHEAGKPYPIFGGKKYPGARGINPQLGGTYKYSGKSVLSPGKRLRRTTDYWLDAYENLLRGEKAWFAMLKRAQEEGGMIVGPDGDPVGLLVDTGQYEGSHYAPYPEALVEPLIKSSTSAYGVCGTCGAPWRRVPKAWGRKKARVVQVDKNPSWSPGCEHGDAPVTPGLVLDPFMGSGTTIAVAHRLNRRSIGIDLDPGAVTLAEERLRRVVRHPRAAVQAEIA